MLAPTHGVSKHALVTGGAGFVGSHLIQSLLERRYRVTAVDNLITGRRENLAPFLSNPNFRFLQKDITHPKFASTLATEHADEIYHLACPTGVPNIQPMAEEMLRASSVGTFHMCELARRWNAKLLFTSSCEVYGHPEITPQHESYTGNVDPIGPRSPYEEGKRFSESVVAMYVRKYALDAKIVRFFNVYGPNMSPHDTRVIPQFLKKIAAGEDLVIYGDGSQQRTFVYVDDVIPALFLVMENGTPGEAYNIGGTRPISIKRLANAVGRATGRKNQITFVPHFIDDHGHRKPSIAKVASLGWKSDTPLATGLQMMAATNGIAHAAAEVLPSAILSA